MTNGLLWGVSCALLHHQIPLACLESFLKQAERYLTGPSGEPLCEVDYVKRAKYMLALPMSQYLRCEPPVAPGIGISWGGKFRRWFRSRLSFCEKNTHLWWSFYQAKRAADPVSEDYVRHTYEKHRAQMECPDPIDSEIYDEIMDLLGPILSEINRSIGASPDAWASGDSDADTLPEYRVTDDGDDFDVVSVKQAPSEYLRDSLGLPMPCGNAKNEWHVASNSACYETSRKEGGQLGYLAGLAPAPFAYGLGSMMYVERAVIDGRLRLSCCVSFYEPEISGFIRQVLQDDERVRMNGDTPKLLCMIQGIIEPLKVRVISKGHASPTYLSKPLQRSLHDKMRSMPCFELIGAPVDPLMIDRLRDFPVTAVAPDTGIPPETSDPLEWFSIDYSAATDGLSARLSAGILSGLTVGFPDTDRERWRQVLAPHICVYPPASGLDAVEQDNGQLMGSILSFPILCLANLGLYLWVIKDVDMRPLSDKLRSVLVNGDDMLYRAPRSLWERHVAGGKRVGLEMSIGKAYHHHTFASVNSQSFHVGDCDRATRAVNFLNTGLIRGQKKVMRVASIDGEDVADVGLLPTVGAIMKGCYNRKKERDVFDLFFRLHHDAIINEADGRNFFVHESLGGCGATLPFDWKWKIAQRHYDLAKYKIEQLGAGYSNHVEFAVYGPSRGPSADDLFTRQPSPIDTPQESSIRNRAPPQFRNSRRTARIYMQSGIRIAAPHVPCMSISSDELTGI